MQYGMKMDIATMFTAGGVAAYAAIAMSYVAPDLGFSLQNIRKAAVTLALAIAAPIVIDFFRKKSDGTK
jgi:hypothetical protein